MKLSDNGRMESFRASLLAFLAIFYMVSSFFWSMPDGFVLKNAVVANVAPFFRWSGLWQGWAMFAPNPIAEDVYVSAVAYFADQSSSTWILSKMDDFDYATRYGKERWRKWANDNLRSDTNRALWQPAAEYLARTMETQYGKKIQKLDLIRHWHNAVIPTDVKILPARENWHKFVFYTLDWTKKL